MIDNESIIDVLEQLRLSQNADRDRRAKIREIQHFLNDADGQWEDDVYNRLKDRPRYTFDMCNPVVSNIWGEMAQNDFDIRVRPAGGNATKERAKTYDGLVRNIETMSNASTMYASAGKKVIQTGFAAWRVLQDWADVDSFDQDLFVREINNAVDRVWFDQGAELQDMSDAMFCFVLQSMTPDAYEARWPEGSRQSVGEDNTHEIYAYKPEEIIVGEYIYKKEITKTLYLMSNGAVYDEDSVQPALDELQAQGITVTRERKRKTYKVVSRFFDGSDWLDDAKDTVFDYLPVVPVYSNFQIVENKVVYWGAIEHLMDSQRVFNYSESRKVEEVALAPRKKLMMTRKQIGSNGRTLQTMNTNADPVQAYDIDEQAPPPYEINGPQINPGLSEVSQSMAQNIERSSGVFGVNPVNNAGLQSNVALERLENRGNIGTYEYFKAQEVAICHTAKILIHALPKVYDTARQQRILNEDGSFEMVPLNTTVLDQDTGQPVTLNDLSQGVYDVTCDIGPAFKNRQEETVKAIGEIAQYYPEVIQRGADVLLNNIQAPGMDVLAERTRADMLQNGLIPEDQMTDEEKQAMQQAQAQPQQPDPNMLAGQAMIIEAENEKTKTDIDVQWKMAQIDQNQQKIDNEATKTAIAAQQNQDKIDNSELVEAMKMQMAQSKQMADTIKTMADTLKSLKEATGADAIISSQVAETYSQQAELLDGVQGEAETKI